MRANMERFGRDLLSAAQSRAGSLHRRQLPTTLRSYLGHLSTTTIELINQRLDSFRSGIFRKSLPAEAVVLRVPGSADFASNCNA